MSNPTYEEVVGGNSGHTEAVLVTFDPRRVAYGDLVLAFFELHDPTTLNRQGNDFGSNYRSAIFYYSPEQERIARLVKAETQRTISELMGVTDDQLVKTEIRPAVDWWPAEEYHQDYLFRRGQSKSKGSLDDIRCYG